MQSTRVRSSASVPGWIRLPALIGCLLASSPAFTEEFEGFTEPFRKIDVATIEAGIVESVAVREGDQVKSGQTLAMLDQDVLKATLAVARATKDARGELNAAVAELALREDRFEKLTALMQKGHATREELERAESEKAIAAARVEAIREGLAIKGLEFERIQTQIARRTLVSPCDGVITQVNKKQGEFLAPNDPVLLTVVELDPLLAVFSVPSDRGRQLKVGEPVQVTIGGTAPRTPAVVDFISPVTDPQSGTTRIKVRLANANGDLRSGEKCLLLLPDASTTTAANTR